MKTILFPTDFSKTADNALTFAIELAKKTQARIIAVNAYDLPYAETVMTHSLLDIMRENSEKAMADVELRLKDAGAAYECLSLLGAPSRIIRQLAEDKFADYVVMGTKGASGIEEVLIGSNAVSIIHSVEIPIFTIPNTARLETIKKILFGFDFKNKNMQKPLGLLADIARTFEAQVLIAHVLDNYDSTNDEMQRSKALIEKYFTGIEHHYKLLNGDDTEDILLKAAEEEKADLLTLVARNYNFFEGLFRSRVTSKIAYHSKLPFLVLHEGK